MMLKDSGVLLVHLLAYGDEASGQVMVECADSLRCSLGHLAQVVAEREADEQEALLAGEGMALYGFIGPTERVEAMRRQLVEKLRQVFAELVQLPSEEAGRLMLETKSAQAGQSRWEWWTHLFIQHVFAEERLSLPQERTMQGPDWQFCCFWAERSPREADKGLPEAAMRIWLEKEQPVLAGQQLVIQSFLLRDLCGRRMIAALPENDSGQWYLLAEGGKKVYLSENRPYIGSSVGLNEWGIFSASNIHEILQNPVYAYGRLFAPEETFRQWQSIFLYALALLPVQWAQDNLKTVYADFLQFMAEEICVVIPTEAFIEKTLFHQALLRQLEEIRRYLKGREESIISRDFLLLLRSRHVYLATIYELLEPNYRQALEDLRKRPPFERAQWRRLLAQAELGDANQKGRTWEQVANYILSRTPGLVITGCRVRLFRQEIDLCCANHSVDEALWELGALVLVECKNWTEKVNAAVIRNLSQVMQVKGAQTLLLFARSGITQAAEEEIRQQALGGNYMLCIDREVLLGMEGGEDFYKWLIAKKNALDNALVHSQALWG